MNEKIHHFSVRNFGRLCSECISRNSTLFKDNLCRQSSCLGRQTDNLKYTYSMGGQTVQEIIQTVQTGRLILCICSQTIRISKQSLDTQTDIPDHLADGLHIEIVVNHRIIMYVLNKIILIFNFKFNLSLCRVFGIERWNNNVCFE